MLPRSTGARSRTPECTDFHGVRAELPQGIVPVVADLLNPEILTAEITPIHDITHIVFGAYVEEPTAAEKSQVNVALLKNLLDVVESTSSDFRHILFYQGGKAYGSDPACPLGDIR